MNNCGGIVRIVKTFPQLFNMMANSKVFLDASIILFLNKTDIFAELCRRSFTTTIITINTRIIITIIITIITTISISSQSQNRVRPELIPKCQNQNTNLLPITYHQSGYQSRQPFLTTLERPPMTIPSTLCRFLILNVFEHFSLATQLSGNFSICS